MTKEISDIVKAFSEAQLHHRQTALATVVHVEGSSYRRPGARMLVEDNGRLTGAISGGCLEGDALRKALLAISQGQNKLVTYDTTDEDDAKLGVQLGCNGIVHILFEPIRQGQNNPVQLLQRLTARRQETVLVTLFNLNHTVQPGTSLLYRPAEMIALLDDAELKKLALYDANEAFASGTSDIKTYSVDGKTLSAFVEYIRPPIAVVIAGAGNDVQPLVELTSILGWETTVVDGRATHATAQRFPKAAKVFVAKPHEVLNKVAVDAQTVFLLMTHNYNYDLALLKEVLPTEVNYIGVLGPKKKMERMWDELSSEGFAIAENYFSKTYSPVGLDIGAETAEEIAVSIVAEIKAAMSKRDGVPLRTRQEAIHTPAQKKTNIA